MSEAPKLPLNEALKNLQSWSDALASTVRDMDPQIRDALNPSKPAIQGAPSRASAAELVFRQVKKKYREVEAAVQMVEDAIWATQRE